MQNPAQVLRSVGFTDEDAAFLAGHRYFHHKTKTGEEILSILQRIGEIYGADVEIVKALVSKHPQFGGLDHERVVREAIAVYGDEGGVRKAVIKWPQFANYNHERVVSRAAVVFGDEDGVRMAIMKCPQFAGIDHRKALLQLSRLGSIAGMAEEEVIRRVLRNPVLACYSTKRYLAALDIARSLEKEGFAPDKDMLEAYFRYVTKSPYVPGSRRGRISQYPASCPEPPLMGAMRKSLRAGR